MNAINRLLIAVVGLALHAGAHAAALGAGQPEAKEPPAPKSTLPAVSPEPVPVVTPRVESAAAVATAPPAVAPMTNYPSGPYAFTYSLDGDAGVSGHIMLGPRSAWIWGVTVRWDDESERYEGSAYQTTETTSSRLDFATGYRRWATHGQTRLFVDALAGLGYHQSETEINSNVDGLVDTRMTQRDTVMGLSVAFGFEYFFTPSISVDGTVGAGVEYTSMSGSYVDWVNNIDLERSGHKKTISLFDAGLRANYYW